MSQLAHGSPAALPTGTRPLAIAPPAAPRKNGVTTDEIANTPPAARRSRQPAGLRPERERCPAQHDPERRQRERHEQGRHDRGKGRRKRRPEDDEIEDEPGVVGLPDRPDRVGDERSRRGATLRAACRQDPRSRPRSRRRRRPRRRSARATAPARSGSGRRSRSRTVRSLARSVRDGLVRVVGECPATGLTASARPSVSGALAA